MSLNVLIDPPSGCYQADTNHTSILWRIKHRGLAWFTGRFARFSVRMGFDSRRIEHSHVRAEIDLRSAQTGHQEADRQWDKQLVETCELLDAAIFPTAVFESHRVERLAADHFRVVGTLDFRGTARPLTMHASYNGSVAEPGTGRPSIGFSATATLRRSDHGLTRIVAPSLSDEVQIIIESELFLTDWKAGGA